MNSLFPDSMVVLATSDVVSLIELATYSFDTFYAGKVTDLLWNTIQIVLLAPQRNCRLQNVACQCLLLGVFL